MRIYIIEDEPLAVKHLINIISSVLPAAEIMGAADNVREASNWLSLNHPDLIFMDIHLGDALSFDIFKNAKVTAPVIFTTAFNQYAIQAFHSNGVAYLLKPISIEDMQEALSKIDNLRKHLSNEDLIRNILSQIKQPSYRERFMVSSGSKLKSIKIDEIAWFASEGRYTKIVTYANQRYLINETLEKLQEVLNPKFFFRINRKNIVGIASISSMVPWSKSRIKLELTPTSEEEVVVSVERSSDFKEWLNQ